MEPFFEASPADFAAGSSAKPGILAPPSGASPGGTEGGGLKAYVGPFQGS